MPRLFVAIDVPDDVRGQLEALCSGVPGARWVGTDQLHLTLRFIGEVDGALFRDVMEGLGDVEVPAFDLALKGVGHFPPRGHAKVLWAGITPNPALKRLRDKVEGALVRLGLDPEERKFSPHITLARFRNGAPHRHLGGYLAEHSLFATPSFPVTAFHLYSSQLSSSGAIHTVEASYPLIGAPLHDWEEEPDEEQL